MGDDIIELHTENESLNKKFGSYEEKWLNESKTKLLQQIYDEKRANLIMSRMNKQMNKQYSMACICYNKLWESEFNGIVSKRDKLQDLNSNEIKLEVHDTYKKDEKITTNFEPIDNEDVINKAYLDEKLKKNRWA